MAQELVARGRVGDLVGAGKRLDALISPGQVGEFRLRMRKIPPGLVKSVDFGLRAAGVRLVDPVHTAPGHELVIRFRRNPGPLLIVAVLAGIGLILALLLTWLLFREIKQIIDKGGGLSLSLGLLLLGAGALYLATRRRDTS